MSESNEISLTTICHGAVPEIFERELRDVLANILDPNTSAEKSRKITLTFVVKPLEDRSGGSVEFSCRATLQPVRVTKSQLFLSRHTGQLKAYAVDQRQIALFNGGEASPSVVQVVK